MTALYTRPSGYRDLCVRWEPDDAQVGAEAIAAVLDDVPDAETAEADAPHGVSEATAANIREKYAALVEAAGGGS